jgi:serine/threonine protein kinase
VLGAGDILSNRYEIVREIGQGGFGQVYEARDNLLALRVIVWVKKRA